MKKLLTLVLLFSLSLFSFGQESGEAFVKGNEVSMVAAKKAGVFEFKLPSSSTKEEVEKNKAYYTDYFSVEYKPEIQIAIVKMVNNTPGNRRVITRFLVSNGVRTVTLDNTKYTVAEFFENFLN
ncbi:MAG: hypothetical protein ACPGU5_04030 [Lishizhenia sp.]